MDPRGVSEGGGLTAGLLDPEAVSRIGSLEIIARLMVEGFVSGLHRSPWHGFSVEFSDHRPYFPGDEIRYVDWKVWGRTDRLHVKRFAEETNLRAHLVLDVSRSMAFRGSERGVTKLRYAVLLAAALAWLMLKQRDAVGLVAFDRAILDYVRPATGRTHLNLLLTRLAALKGAGPTRTRETFQELAGRIRRRGLILLLSDLLADPDDIVRGLRYFRHQRHEVVVFHVLDPAEIDLPGGAETVYRDLETGEEVQAAPGAIREAYRTGVQRLVQGYRNRLRDARIDYHLLPTDVPFDRGLLAYLRKRSRLG